jgi:two-component system, NarL family, sensor histidine kinase DesK
MNALPGLRAAGLGAPGPAARAPGEDDSMPASSGREPARVPAGSAPAEPAEEWQLPAARTRKVLLSVFVTYFVITPAVTDVIQHATPATVFVAAASLAFTGIVGWRVVFRDRPGLHGTPWAWLAVIVGLAVAVFVVGGGLGWEIILAIAAAACGRFTATAWPAVLGAFSCSTASLIVTVGRAQRPDAGNLALLIIVPSMAAFLTYATTKRNETVAELRQTRAELARVAVAEERLRIARDLHDLLGQSLSLITLKAELSRRMIGTDTTSAAREMAELEAVARQSLSDVRAAVAGYRQPDLAAELGVARQLLAAAGLSCQITRPADLCLPADVNTVLAWTVREGITNVVRHARATGAVISVTTTAAGAGTRVTAEITDDGTGPLAGPAGSGLAGLGERVRQLGGNLMAGPARSGGFRLQVTIPLTVRHS